MKRSNLFVSIVVTSLFGGILVAQTTTAPAPFVEYPLNGNGNGHGMIYPTPMFMSGNQSGEQCLTSLWADGNLESGRYEVTGVDPKIMGNIARVYKDMVRPFNGIAEVAETEGGFLLIVSAPPMMQRTISEDVKAINMLKPGKFNGHVGNIFYHPRFRTAESLAAAIRPELNKKVGLVHVDVVGNMLTIEDDPSYTGFLQRVLDEYDIKPPRIDAKVYIVEVKTNNESRIGVDLEAFWDFVPTSISGGISAQRIPLGSARGGEIGVDGLKLAGDTAKDTLSSLRIVDLSAAVAGMNPQTLAGFLTFSSGRGTCRVEKTVVASFMNGTPVVVDSSVNTVIPATVTGPDGNKKRMELSPVEGFNIVIDGTIFGEGQNFKVDATCTSIVGESPKGEPIVSVSHISSSIGFPKSGVAVFSGLTRTRKVDVVHGPSWDDRGWFSKKVKVDEESKLYICVAAEPATSYDKEDLLPFQQEGEKPPFSQK